MKYHLAVDVGSYYVKVVSGYERNDKFIVEKIGYFPNPFPGFRTNLVEREQDVLAKTLKDFLRRQGIREKETVSNVSGAGVTIHYFDVPRLSESEISSAIQLEMMQVTPGGTKNLEYDHLLFPAKNGRNTVLFIGYQKDKCEFFTKTLQRSGLRPLIMDHDALAVLNCFNYFNKKSGEVVFILNVGHVNTNFTLADSKGGFILVRDIPFGGSNLVDSIAKDRAISREDAEIYSTGMENADEVKKTVSGNLDDIMLEARTGLEFFKTRTGKSPENLFLTGGVSTMPGMCESFEQNLKIKTVLWNPLEQANMKILQLPEDIKKRGHMFTVSLGLALRKIK